MASIEIAVVGMHCASCGLLIDEAIEDLPGVTRAETDVRRALTRVQFDPDTTGLADLVEAIESVGYQVPPPNEALIEHRRT